MSKKKYESEFHPGFFDTLDDTAKDMTEEQFEVFFELFKHEQKILEKDPYSNSRECEFGILRDEGFRTMTFHSKLPKKNTGDMRVIFKVDEDDKIVFYFAVGKRINTRPRPANDIYSKAERMLKAIEDNSN